MAYYSKTKTGWRAQIERRGVRTSRTFATKAAAQRWVMDQERDILDGVIAPWPKKTVRQAVRKYLDEVTPAKRTAHHEALRLEAFLRVFPADTVISEVTAAQIAEWRDLRLKTVTPGTVKREANSIRDVWTKAAKEWGWLPWPTPWPKVKMPADNHARDRLVSWREARAILRRLDYRTGHPPVSGLQNVAWAFLVALRTGMRASEILGLKVEDVSGAVVTLGRHKTFEVVGRRKVPLTPAGTRLVGQLVKFARARKRERLLEISAPVLDAQFRKVTRGLMIEGLRFHDSRGSALTYLSRKMDVMSLARVSGHRNINILHAHYYRETEESIARRLAGGRTSESPTSGSPARPTGEPSGLAQSEARGSPDA